MSINWDDNIGQEEFDSLAASSIVVGYQPIDNPSKNRSSQGNTSWFRAVFIVINAALGAGLLTFPEAYHRGGGIIVGLSIQSFLLIFIFGALLILAYCADQHNSQTYQDVVSSMCGTVGKLSCAICIALYCFGTCIAFLILIGDQWDKFLRFATKDDHFYLKWYMNSKFTISITSTLIILPMCFPKKLDFLANVSAIGVFGVLYMAVIVIVKFFTTDFLPGPIRHSPEHWTDVFLVIPTICFAYQCHVSSVPVYACLRDRTVKNFSKTITVAITVCVLCYTTTAIFGYLTFGSHVTTDILVAYDSNSIDVLIAIALMAVKTYTTYPILHFCGRAAFETVYKHFLHRKNHRDLLDSLSDDIPEPQPDPREFHRRIIETIVWFFATLILAITIPNLSTVIGMLGALASVFIFVYPGLCLLQLTYSSNHWSNLRKKMVLLICFLYVMIGGLIFGITFTQAILNAIDSSS